MPARDKATTLVPSQRAGRAPRGSPFAAREGAQAGLSYFDDAGSAQGSASAGWRRRTKVEGRLVRCAVVSLRACIPSFCPGLSQTAAHYLGLILVAV
jgi:hypothetical protein